MRLTVVKHCSIMSMLVLLLSGCAVQSWVPGPNARGTFDETRGQCSLAAKSGATGFYASGSPRFVAGAAIAHGIGEAIRTQQSFNDCMQASGWVAADGQSQVSAAMQGLSACSEAVYNDPQFAELKPLAPTSSNSTTSVQMTNGNLATDREVHLLRERRSRVLPCRQHAIEQLRITSPVLAAAASEASAKTDQNYEDLVNRRITWGEFVSRNKAAGGIVQARVASNSMAPPTEQPINSSIPRDDQPQPTTARAETSKYPSTIPAQVRDFERSPVTANAQQDVPPPQPAPTIRAMGWEATVSRLTGAPQR